MKACDYIVFGCLLEKKPYADLHIQMVYDYFRKHLPTFEEKEMRLDDMCSYFDRFADMVCMGWLKNLLGSRNVAVCVFDGAEEVGALVLSLEKGHIEGAQVYAGPPPVVDGRKMSKIAIPLSLLSRAIGSDSELKRIFYRLLIGCNIVCLDLPRRILV